MSRTSKTSIDDSLLELQGYLQSLRAALSTLLIHNASDREAIERLQSVVDKANDTVRQIKERQ